MQVCRDAENVDEAFAAVLGENLGVLDTRIQLVKEKEGEEHEKLRLGPDKAFFLLRQRVVFEIPLRAAG